MATLSCGCNTAIDGKIFVVSHCPWSWGEGTGGERGEGVVEVPNERDNKPLKETDLAVAQAFLDS